MKLTMKYVFVVLFVLSLGIYPGLVNGQETQPSTETESLTAAIAEEKPVLPLASRDNDLLATIRSRGELQVGVSIFMPWVMNSQHGELAGFEIDVAKRLAEDLGVEIRFEVTSWYNIIHDLLEEEFDIIISGMSLTPQRALLVNFSSPYSFSEVKLLASRQVAGNFKTLEDFNKPEVTLAVRENTTGAEIAAQKFPQATLRMFDNEAEAFKAVLDGQVHGIVASSPRPNFEALRYPDNVFMPLDESLATFFEGFVIRKGDPDFLSFLNTWVVCYTANGWLSERRHHWFETLDWVDHL